MLMTAKTARLDPQIETESGLAGILHWQQLMVPWDSDPNQHQPTLQEAHCLMRLISVNGQPTVILSELMSCPVRQDHHYFSRAIAPLFSPCATAAYRVIQDRIPDPSAITWVSNSGGFSTPDTLWTSADTEGFSRVELTWTGTEFAPNTLGDRHRLPEADPFPGAEKPEPVAAVLEQLGWRNWIDD